jgi:hypothetical protein
MNFEEGGTCMLFSGSRLRMILIGLLSAGLLSAQEATNPGEERIREFLLNAKVVAVRNADKGKTHPPRLTLSDGTMTHDASFQCVNEEKPIVIFSDGRREVNFRDSYKYNLAAYELAKILGLEDMMPVTVERLWNNRRGSLSWWLPAVMDEATRIERGIIPPDEQAWNRQMYKKRIFAELVYDSDPNLTNVLISKDWHLWMIDFTRAFRFHKMLRVSENILQSKCERKLLERLRNLDRNELTAKTQRYLTPASITGLMARRDKIVSLIDQMIAKKGEKEVLFDDPPSN